jgi:SNF2 family DNA or RNA helicase
MNPLEKTAATLDWKPPEQRGKHTFQRAVATEQFLLDFAANRPAARELGVCIFASHTGGETEVARFTEGPNAPKQTVEKGGPDAPLGAEWNWLREPLPDGKRLMRHQRFSVHWLLAVKRGILALDMGLGKTLCALVAAQRIATATIVVCPAGLRDNWEREGAALGVRLETYSWAKLPPVEELPTPFTLIADEAHYAQSSTSIRGKGLAELAAAAAQVFLLTGTPLKNGQPKNLFQLLRAVGHPLAASKQRFEQQFCDAKLKAVGGWIKDGEGHFKCSRCGKVNDTGRVYPSVRMVRCLCGTVRRWLVVNDATGATNLDVLHEQVRPVLLRRMKSDCLDLPKKTRVVKKVEPSAEMKADYNRALSETLAKYQQRVRTGAISSDGEALAMLGFVRIAASRAKVEFTTEAAEEVIEQGGQVIIFTEFVETALTLAKHFDVPPYIGDTSRAERTRIEQRFQEGKQRAFVGTSQAGGVGITLTAANTVILHDRPMTPGDAEQAEDRAYRIGQHWPVTALWPQAFPVDEKIDAMLDEKRDVANRVLTGEAVAAGATATLRASQVLFALFKK